MKTNPWLGLSSYDEEKIKEGYKFCGRSAATTELFSLVDNNVFVTMYGKSGIGKSSLLQAGLFPKLRDNDYFPVYIRLGNSNTPGLSYAKAITDAIDAELGKAGFEAVQPANTIADEQPATAADNYLWHYFVSREFRDTAGRVVFPVVVIDQFEELFFLDKQQLDTLMRQVYLLIDDSSLSASTADSYVTNYRFLFSIREDDFFRLEDAIERQRLVDMKYNRYRLLELSDTDATDVILQPSGNIINAEEEAIVVQRIIKEAKGESGEINSAILSLLCSRLYDAAIAKGDKVITMRSLEVFLQSSGGNFLASFFDDVIARISDRKKWEYIEDMLVTDDGRRNSVLESQFNKNVPGCDFLFSGKMAMLRYVTYSAGAGRHVEMIHDLLANHLKSSRNERRQRVQIQKMRRRQRRNAALIAVILLVAGFFAYQFVSISRKNDEITKKNSEIKKEREKLLITQSRYLMSEAQKEYDNGNITKALRLTLYALPKDLDNPDRPYVPEVEQILRKSDMYGNLKGDTLYSRSVLHHNRFVHSAFFSPDGRFVVTASWDGIVRIWDVVSGIPVTKPIRHEGNVNSAVFSPNGEYVVTASSDSTARVWNASTGEPLTPLLQHNDVVYSAIFSPNGEYVVTASWDNTARVWDAVTGKPVLLPFRHDGAVNSVAFSPDGKNVVTASEDNTVRVWNIKTGEQMTPPMLHGAPVSTAFFSSNGRYVVTASNDKSARVWDAVTGKLLKSLLQHNGIVNYASFSPDGKYVVTASDDSTSCIWNIDDGKIVVGPLLHAAPVRTASFSQDGRYVVTASDDKTARIWETDNGTAASIPLEHNRGVLSAVFSPDGKSVLTASWDNTARIWMLGDTPPEVGLKPNDCTYIEKCVSKGRYALVLLDDNTACVQDTIRGNYITTLMEHNGNVKYATFSPNGELVVTASTDNTVRIWNAMTSEPVVWSISHSNIVNFAAFSSDSRYIATASSDNTARVWDATTGKPVTEPLHHKDYVNTAIFSMDGKYIVTASRDKTARVWDAITGEPVTEPLQHDSSVCSAVFSPDGKYIVTTSVNGTVRVWPFPPLQELIDKYRKDPEHDWSLTQEEKDEYSLE